MAITHLLPGTEVHARGLRWEIVFSQQLGAQTLYRLRGLENAVRGREMDVLSPFEAIQPVIRTLQPERAAPLRNWLVYHQAFLLEQALGSDALLAVQPGRLRMEPYQLVPVLRALRMSRPRLLLADGVGLGKTIQAGLILTELAARRIAHRILIVSPAGPLLEQWKTEMRERFGLRLDHIDRARLEEVRRQSELGANPFDAIPIAIASIDFLKQETVLDLLERSSYDVIVVDEAHHCMDPGSQGEREDSQRRKLAELLARQSDALLLLTATPHDGYDRSFASLCELLDPSLVDGEGNLRGQRYRQHVVRRLKRHITDPATGQSIFPERQVIPIAVAADPGQHAAYIQLQHSLLDLIAPELRRAFRARRYSDVLSFIALLKRSVSTAAACQSTLGVVAQRFQRLVSESAESQESRRQRLRTLRDYQRRLQRFGAVSAEEEAELHLLEAEDLAQRLVDLQRDVQAGSRQLKRVADVVAALDDLVLLAEEAQSQDPKLAQLVAEVQAIRREEPSANVLIYSEYVDSQAAAAAALTAAGAGLVLTMSGEDDERTRQAITDRFRSQRGLLLVSTDTAAEGLNLHERCHHLIHLELPFNPNRLEQRNGRIDRYGQTQPPIVRYLYLRGTFEERILMRLVAKFERQRALLTFVPNTLGVATGSDAVNERLLAGLLDEDQRLFDDTGARFDLAGEDAEDGADPAVQELLEEIDRSLRAFQQAARANTWLGEAGLNAEARLVDEAGAAHSRGLASSVDLARFVVDAVLLDGGQRSGAAGGDSLELILPPAWTHGLDDAAGYDPVARRVRLTTRLDLMHDVDGQPVDYLGRGHPLVRRALDRVRNLSFGGETAAGQEIRASAVAADVAAPELLYTFLGRVASRAGRELERVLAVRVTLDGAATFHADPAEWLPLADPAQALRTGGLWQRHFAGRVDGAAGRAQAVAQDGFQPLAQRFADATLRSLDDERQSLERWLEQRAEDLTRQPTAQPAQPTLFDPAPASFHEFPSIPPGSAPPTPAMRLATFYHDGSQHPARRAEADGILRLYNQRREDLEARLALGEPEIVPLGLLMLIPDTLTPCITQQLAVY